MDTSEIKKRVKEIKGVAWDDERAHSWEDKLWEDVLRAIANEDVDNPYTLAKEALKTKKIDFSRWCA